MPSSEKHYQQLSDRDPKLILVIRENLKSGNKDLQSYNLLRKLRNAINVI